MVSNEYGHCLWLQINGMNVSCASHEYAVQLIRETRNQLVLRVLTVATPSTEKHSAFDASCHTDGTAVYCCQLNVV